MSNPTAPEVVITLDRERRLRFDFNAAAHFEAATGRNIFEPGVLTKPTATTTRALLWCMLVHEDPQLTLDDVGKMINFQNFVGISAQINKAYEANTPDGGGKKRPLAP